MVDYIREIVSGKKRRYRKDGFNLDLTYITDRIIAMSFPGAGFEAVYRNDISDVAKLLNAKHGTNYVLINLSGRKYDYDKFDRRVVDFPFEDHHSPPLELLFRACKFMYDYMSENPNNVVIVHCLAGKGRTGTVISCFFLYTRRFETTDDALLYYKRRRFEKGGGVTQPSQIRYVKYFAEALHGYLYKQIVLKPVIVKLEMLIIHGLPRISSNYFRPYVEIHSVKDNFLLYTTKKHDQAPRKYPIGDQSESIPTYIVFNPNETPLMTGDLLIKVYHMGSWESKLVFRFGIGTSFLKAENDKIVLDLPVSELDPDSTKDDERFPINFKVQLFANLKPIPSNPTAPDQRPNPIIPYVNRDQTLWDSIYKLLGEYNPDIKKEASVLLFKYPARDNVEEVLNNYKPPINEVLSDNSAPNEQEEELNSSFTDNGPAQDGKAGANSYNKNDDNMLKEDGKQEINPKMFMSSHK